MEWYDFIVLAVLAAGYFVYWKFLTGPTGKRSKGSPQKNNDKSLNRKEEAAWKLLQEKGYRLKEIRPTSDFNITVDNKEREYHHQGRFAVEKEGKSYLVAMKGGQTTPLSSASQRKDLLLDYLIFRPAAVLLYDSEKKKFHEVSFALEGKHPLAGEKKHIKAALVVLIVLGCFYLFFTF